MVSQNGRHIAAQESENLHLIECGSAGRNFEITAAWVQERTCISNRLAQDQLRLADLHDQAVTEIVNGYKFLMFGFTSSSRYPPSLNNFFSITTVVQL